MWALRSLHTPLGRGALRWERMDVCGVRGRWCCSFLPLPGSGQQNRTGSPLSLAAPQLEQRMSGSGCEHHYTRGEAHGLWALLPGFSWSFPPWGGLACVVHDSGMCCLFTDTLSGHALVFAFCFS